jgi:3,2-trans-enoyl-CoA isomerase
MISVQLYSHYKVLTMLHLAHISPLKSFHRLQALSSSIQSVESNSNMQCLILQSSVPNIFSSGLDLTELHNPNETRLVDFWRAFQDVYLNLYGSRLACIAAMEGHAPAAGCMLALSCDVRIMQDTASYKIGLNESQLGIVAPPWLVQQLVDTVGRRRAELALSLGLLYNPHDALKLQLVDHVVANVRQHAVETANVWRAVPPTARVLSKLLLRKDRLDALRADPQSDIDNFVSIILNKTTQANISAYLQRMAAKKKK